MEDDQKTKKQLIAELLALRKRLILRDNGRGISEEAISRTKSLGLVGMRERAFLFGGELLIQGTPGKGTTVILKIPA